MCSRFIVKMTWAEIVALKRLRRRTRTMPRRDSAAADCFWIGGYWPSGGEVARFYRFFRTGLCAGLIGRDAGAVYTGAE